MRPEIIFSLFKPITSLKGVGPRIATWIEKVAGSRIIDLCWHLPLALIDRRYAPDIADAQPGVIATLTVTVLAHKKPANRRMPYKVTCGDDTGRIDLVFFHAHEDYLQKNLPVNETRVISGKLETFGSGLQMTHPDHIGTLAEIDQLKAVEAVYPLTAGLNLKTITKVVTGALDQVPELTEWIDPSLMAREKWLEWKPALIAAHNPTSEEDLAPNADARTRLAYDELLSNQLALAIMRREMKNIKGRAYLGNGRLCKSISAHLPFQLTNAQTMALAEISADMSSEIRMLRLLQGDVGSGKTVVALLAMTTAIEAGCQTVLMAPTEVLARQHLATIAPLAEKAGIEVVTLTGRDKGKPRQLILDKLASGEAKIAIGTHALFQDDIVFNNLGFAVIDEQHRFGVHQRLQLAAKGTGVDVLVMTATPIPRTLMLTAYGDMDVSRLMEKPIGRKPIDTRVLPIQRMDDVVQGIGRSLQQGAKVFWVCPLVEESEKVDLAAAEDRHVHLSQVFGSQVGLIHGRMKAAEKDAAMAAFINGNVKVLVATTVIEVGVDVPDATVMVIEHAERFGLAQLHQLRGRIGRGDAESNCLLLYAQPLGEIAKARLKIMRETEDGFVIAEEDLKLRGAGELLGTRQSGMAEFRMADLTAHSELLAMARDDAALFLQRDPHLESERGQAIRTLLYLFNCDSAVRNLRSG